MRPVWRDSILAPFLAPEPSPNVLTFAAECIKVLHGAYAAGKAYPKSQVLEAEAAASCQARHAPPPHARHPFHRL